MNWITFDIETYSPGGLERIDTNEFRVSVCGAYFSWTQEYVAFLEDDIEEFLRVLPHVDLVVGYNHEWFDLPVLQKYASFQLSELPTYDIMLEIEKKIGYKLKLDDVCKANLGTQKTDTYEQFKHYYKDKNWLPLIDYCMHDVKLTEQIFGIIQNRQELKYIDLLETKKVLLDPPNPGKRTISQVAESIF